jgi:hypothetical protein
LAIQPEKRQLVEAAMKPVFKLASEQLLRVPMRLDGVGAMDLVGMTPNAWFMSDEQRAKFEAVTTLEVTAEFQVLIFDKIDEKD